MKPANKPTVIKKKQRIKKVNKTSSINSLPKGEFRNWLIGRMKARKLPLEKKRIIEYAHIYNRTRQLMPQMIDFVETIFKRRKTKGINTQLVFLGRGSRPFYKIAHRLGPEQGIQTKNIKLIEAGRRLTGKIYSNKRTRTNLLNYMKTQGIDLNKPITFIDTGVIGTVPHDLIELFKIEHPKTKTNGFMFYGRNVRFENIKHYSPSKSIKWKLPNLSEREVRSLIEELPKSVTTIKTLVTKNKKTKPEYNRGEPEEVLGSSVVRKAIRDYLTSYMK